MDEQESVCLKEATYFLRGALASLPGSARFLLELLRACLEVPRPAKVHPLACAASCFRETGNGGSKCSVCRDFAVLEDHTLAHSLQEQEIEHHLATNVQRNRLVQYDLQMAKQLQEEEDRKARVRLQEQHKDIERQDCEIAQEIQVKLVIEAEQRRRQEEDDEDIARILQQKELQEEKRRKKPPPDPLRQSASEEGCYPENREHLCRSPRETGPELPRPGSADGQPPQTRDPRRGPPLISEGLDLEAWGSSSETRKTKEHPRKDRENRRERKQGRQERPPRKGPPGEEEEQQEDEPTDRGYSRPAGSQERTRGPLPLVLDAEAPRASRGIRDQKRPQSRERPPRTPPPFADWEEERTSAHRSNGPHRQGERGPNSSTNGRERQAERPYSKSRSPNPDCRRLPLPEDRRSPRPHSRHARHHDSEAAHGRRLRREDGEREPEGAPASPASHYREGWNGEASHPRNPGMKSRGAKEDAYARPRLAAAQDPEFYDAEIAWKLQEEELLASQVDKRAAQVAQDEEIARLLMAEEKKAYKKAKEREKKRQDQDWKDPHESACSRSREGYEPHRGRSEKPTRAAAPLTKDLNHPSSLTNQHNLAHQISKSESAHKGYHYKQ
ncbi:coiled-coil domain-containing protein 50 isoform X2 [Python bivittatus]|uniref:Coiled-coil domain-containing protein 50 isoform X2 n=1 Tax=Python bivittatus TaxID=176946 RepID=A0A9F3W0R7_PYTBI|nr:coiled-coil domain-containing protein 50 isoform X2 [Python bivittatus]